MHLLSKIRGRGTTTLTTISDKHVSIYCSYRAQKALALRNQPLLVEVELAFACIAHKAVRFHETQLPPDAIQINAQLALLITTLVPDSCTTDNEGSGAANPALRRFLPGWIRLDYVKGTWLGEYGF